MTDIHRTGKGSETDGNENAEAEIPIDSQVSGVTAKRDAARERKFREVVDKINQKYAGVFRRLSK
jgi:hypothetical protein